MTFECSAFSFWYVLISDCRFFIIVLMVLFAVTYFGSCWFEILRLRSCSMKMFGIVIPHMRAH